MTDVSIEWFLRALGYKNFLMIRSHTGLRPLGNSSLDTIVASPSYRRLAQERQVPLIMFAQNGPEGEVVAKGAPFSAQYPGALTPLIPHHDGRWSLFHDVIYNQQYARYDALVSIIDPAVREDGLTPIMMPWEKYRKVVTGNPVNAVSCVKGPGSWEY